MIKKRSIQIVQKSFTQLNTSSTLLDLILSIKSQVVPKQQT